MSFNHLNRPSPTQVSDVTNRADQGFEDTIDRLADYLSYPAISCQPDNHLDVRRLAAKVREDVAFVGLDNARLLELDGALPVVAAEWLRLGPEVPTILIYGHLDIQPVEAHNWSSSPHTAVRRGDRLYARGTSDDMGGWVSHLAAIEAWIQTHGGLPCNVRLIIEGEEEIGSPNLERFMDAFPDAFEADVMLLTDCENPSVDVPGLTVSLRGLIEVELTCSALEADVHSGLWGGMLPDPAIALCQIISSLVDADGRLIAGRRPITEEMVATTRDVPIDDETIRVGARLVDGVSPLPTHGVPPGTWLWRQPSVTVLSTTLPAAGKEKNAIRKNASALLSVRLAPDQGPEEMLPAIEQAVAACPASKSVAVQLKQVKTFGEGWLYDAKGPAFDAADRAYQATWGSKLVRVGVGGSIPFVALFGRRFGDLPLILNGVLDPESTAHGPNESIHLGVFSKAIAANIHLYSELGAIDPKDL
ncbi:MAG: hypothetical protein CMH53_09535 [Myxococcales bacterium]|nr:hypothetical protein [Myxococcales bacterium]|tara:strand:- start:84 stop:1508 length:1425 start_codon:yes stop_codon:yes gene_type:complete